MRTKMSVRVLLCLVLALLVSAPPVFADQSFHSTRLPLALTAAGQTAGHPELRAGHVVDIHTNGPVVYAMEEYLLNGAKPDTDYQVVLHFYMNTACTPGGLFDFILPGVTLTTDSLGNANGRARSTPADILEILHNTDWGITWTFESGGVAAYITPCAHVHLD